MRLLSLVLSLSIVSVGLTGCWNACDGRWKYDPPLAVCANTAKPAPGPVASDRPTKESGPASRPSEPASR